MNKKTDGRQGLVGAQVPDGWLRIASVGAPHGLKGGFFCMLPDGRQEPLRYSRLALAVSDKSLRQPGPGSPDVSGGFRLHEVLSSTVSGGRVVVVLKDVSTRSAAEALRGMDIFVERSAQELAQGEVLVADFIGTRVEDEQGKVLGCIRAVHDFGAQLTLEIAPDELSASFYFPYLDGFVVSHDVTNRLMIVRQAEDFQAGEV